MKTLRLIFGDQLNYNHSWYGSTDPEITYLIMEMRQETDYVLHHAQKVIGFFAAMYNFAEYLKKKGHNVIHLKINDDENNQDLILNLNYFINKLQIERFEYQLPDEERLDNLLSGFCQTLTIGSRAFDTEHFYTSRRELEHFFAGKKGYLMENFYRHMRQKHQVLMDNGKPEGKEWNFDKENRNPLKGEIQIPSPLEFRHDYTGIWDEIVKSGAKVFGVPSANSFPWPTTRKQALAVLDHFVLHSLKDFGTYQDAMHADNAFLFHSRLSFALNLKMISPKEVIQKVESHWKANKTHIKLNSVEGFIRQILGWREYMRGIYWAKMPGYRKLNYFNNSKALPDWFWTGNTKMNCLHKSIRQSLDHAYAHHIQRLMVTGNFMLLIGAHPDAVDKWYLGIYIDAIEWVEITNTRGMSQFADGGIVGTKPYVSSAAYIHKMSNYCKGCYYDKFKKSGTKACPFNSLYWNFFNEHSELLSKNQRLKMMYNVWNKMDPEERADILVQADTYLKQLNEL